MRRIGLIILLVAAVGGGVLIWRSATRAPAPAPPALESPGETDPEIVAAIARAVSEVRARPRDLAARTKLAYVYHANGFSELAEAAYQHALGAAPDDAALRHNFALLKAGQGDFVAAREAMNEAIRLERTFAASHWQLGFWLLDEGLNTEAEAAFRNAAALDPADPAAQVGLARVFLQTDRPREAVGVLERLLATGPANGDYLAHLLGQASRRAGLSAEPAEAPAAQAGSAPVWTDARAALIAEHRAGYAAALKRAEELLQAERPAEAAAIAQRVLRSRPGDVNALNYLGQSQLAGGAIDAAIATLMQAIARDRDHAITHYNLADAYLRKNDHDRSLQHAQRALAINPMLGEAQAVIGQLHARRNELDPAAVALARALELGADSEQAHLLYGGVLIEQSRWPEAEAAFRKLLLRYPRSATGYVGLARARAEQHAIDEAITLMQQATRLDPKAPALIPTARRIGELRQAAAANPR